jgi:drug/metabolite transporter (DMT)-like permease
MTVLNPGPVSGFFWMIVICTLWSTAGVVSRQLESAVSLEVTFWRSFFCGLTLIVVLVLRSGPAGLVRQVRGMGLPGVFSGFFWATMFTCFMVAIMLTSVTNTLLIVSLAPLFAAILGRWFLGERIAMVTALSIVLAGFGLWWMLREGLSGDGLLGVVIALGTPIAAACNLILLRRSRGGVSLIPAVMLGGIFSALLTLPFIFPVQASESDLLWLAFLGVFQLAVPCSLLVWLSRYLPAQEIALLSLFEVVLGPIWAWLWGGEVITRVTLQGAALILGALVLNTLMRQRSFAR